MKKIEETMCYMADGIGLSTLLFFPNTKETSYPVILTRTPYDKGQFIQVGLEWAKRGFIFVAQDVRGKYKSQGQWVPYMNEGRDGIETVQWLHSRKWCNGTVFLTGGSYGAYTSFAAKQNDEKGLIKGISTQVPAMGLFETAFHSSGIFHFSDRCWWDASFGSSKTSKQEEYFSCINDNPELLWHLPVSTFNQKFPMELSSWERLFINDDVSEVIEIKNVNTPALHIGGWFDPFVRQTIHNYLSMKGVNVKQALIIGPWGHEINSEVEFIYKYENAIIPLSHIEENWYLDTEKYDYPPVLLYVTGSNTWIYSNIWPLAETKTETLFLNPDFGLCRELSSSTKCISYIYDPTNPCPSLEYPNLRNDIETRDDVISFTSNPLVEDLTISNSVEIELYVQSSSPLSDYYVYLSEVDSQGRSVYVTHGIVRLDSGEGIQKINVELHPVLHTIRQHNLIRIAITNSSFPRYSRNLNVHNPDQSDQPKSAEQHIYLGGKYPAAINIPITNIERCKYEFEN